MGFCFRWMDLCHSSQAHIKFQRLMKQPVIAKLNDDWNIFQYSFSFLVVERVWTDFHWEIQNTILYFAVLQPRKTRIFGNSILVLLFNSLINLSELGTTVDINYRGFLLNNFFLPLYVEVIKIYFISNPSYQSLITNNSFSALLILANYDYNYSAFPVQISYHPQ